MDIMPMSVVLFGSIPEALLMVWAGLLLLGHKPALRRLIVVGLIQGLCAYFIRRYLTFGYHMILQVLSLTLLTFIIMKVRFTAALLAVIIACAVVILMEGTTMVLFKVNTLYMFSMGWRRILYFLPQDMALFGIIYICRKKNISLLMEFSGLKKFVG